MTSQVEAVGGEAIQAPVEGAPGWAALPVGAILDVRPLLARGEEPFQAIMAAAQVQPGQVLRLRSSFEPFPLYHVLGKQGFQHWSRQLAPGDWEILFYKAPAGAGPGVSPEAGEGPPASSGGETGDRGPVLRPITPARAPAKAPVAGTPAPGGAATAAAAVGGAEAAWPAPVRTVTIDVSDLVPPEPMIRILEALEQLYPGEALLVHHVRRPVYLYARLDELGYLHQTQELGPNQVELRILKPAGHAEATR